MRLHLHVLAYERAAILLATHSRMREATNTTHIRHRIEPHLPVDLLGIYALLPVIQ
jgi:hypothetical protein